MSPPPSSTFRTPRVRKPTIPPKPNSNHAPLFLSDHTLYGSARLGQRQQNKMANQNYVPPGTHNLVGIAYVQRGWKAYELSNHLGNVLSVISDRKEAGHCNDTLVAFYDPDIIQNNDYYPFGSPMEGRGQQAKNYRYGFNGKEKDQEGMGGGSSTYDYGFRIYNPALGKFLSVDPLTSGYPWFSPYHYASNSPILNIDVDGLEGLECTVKPLPNEPGFLHVTITVRPGVEQPRRTYWLVYENGSDVGTKQFRYQQLNKMFLDDNRLIFSPRVLATGFVNNFRNDEINFSLEIPIEKTKPTPKTQAEGYPEILGWEKSSVSDPSAINLYSIRLKIRDDPASNIVYGENINFAFLSTRYDNEHFLGQLDRLTTVVLSEMSLDGRTAENVTKLRVNVDQFILDRGGASQIQSNLSQKFPNASIDIEGTPTTSGSIGYNVTIEAEVPPP